MNGEKLPVVRLQPQRHRRAAHGHPWVYSNEIIMDAAAKALPPGAIVRFAPHDGGFIGTGSFNTHSLIAGRIFTRAPLETIDQPWLRARLADALALRGHLIPEPYYRLIHAEADGLPGLIIDRFDRHLGVQLNTAGMQLLWPELKAALLDLLQPATITLHNDSSSRVLEGLDRVVETAHGEISGLVPVRENNLTYFADPVGGQKTGWYFDQRDNHALMARFAAGKRVLDLYCHAGGFGLLAAKHGAITVTGVDSSQPALDLAAKAASENGLTPLCSWKRGDVFEDLERRISGAEKYDITIADPPPFVKNRKDVAAGARGYRKLAKLSAQVTAAGGLLYIASCSHNMELPQFTEEVARGLQEARRTGRILYSVGAAPDHPIHPHLPESAYLKGLILRLD